jgi:transglutaminase-like putative cysteine protease
MLTMRLETEDNAKDVDYSNDVIVSNAAMVTEPIANPRSREKLTLKVSGPLKEDHLFNDERQFFKAVDDHWVFTANQVRLGDMETATIPVEDPEVARYLEPTTFVQSDHPEIVAKAKEIVADETDTLKISNKICAWVNEHMTSTFSARLTNALEVLNSMEGDCTEHSILFIGLCRAAGVPAREVAGLVYVEGGQPGFYFHQWAKVWVGKWIDVDPTFNQPRADVTHIKLAEGDLFRQTKIIPIIGKLTVEVISESEPAPTPDAAAT